MLSVPVIRGVMPVVSRFTFVLTVNTKLEYEMKPATAFALFLLFSMTAVHAADEREPERIEISTLSPDYDGADVIMTFKVANTYRISGGVPKGNVPSFGIEAVVTESDHRFSVLVVGELADAMGRFGYGSTHSEDRLAGMYIEAHGKIRMYPAPKNAPERGPSYQLVIGDWKGFRIKSPL